MDMTSNDALIKQYYDTPTVTPDTILVNGLARYRKFARENETSRYIPTSVFEVKKV